MSPICWLGMANAPLVTVKVFLRSAPQPRTSGPSSGSVMGSGAYPRERRMNESSGFGVMHGPAFLNPHAGLIAGNSHDRVVNPHKDVPVMDEKAIDDTGKLVNRLIIVPYDWFFRQVPARHHQG